MKFILVTVLMQSPSAAPIAEVHNLPMSLAQCTSIGKAIASDMMGADGDVFATFTCAPRIEGRDVARDLFGDALDRTPVRPGDAGTTVVN